MRNATALVLVLFSALLACKSKTTGSVAVDGAAFEVDTCRSGKANIPAFEGVDFLDKGGRRVRFLTDGSGQVRTFLFPPNATTGEMIGEGCGTISLSYQNSEVNGVKNIQGSVNANCTGSGHTIVANATFESCH
jgi:hypothetical protein